MKRLLLLVVAGACVGTETATCPGSGTLCPAGTVCLQLAPDDELCVRPDQFPPCVGANDGVTCTLVGDIAGTCYGGACLPAECGNRRIDAGEACDDGANRPGDGCSADCRSIEICGNGIVDPMHLKEGTLVPPEQCDDRDLIGHDGCSSSCNTEATRWVQLDAAGPEERSSPAMTYDAERRRLVLFGGIQVHNPQLGGTRTFSDTWESDGLAWTPVPVALAPSSRSGHAIAYDPVQRRVVMFGGSAGNLLDDTWLLDANQWTFLTPTVKPPPRSHHSMAYHPDLGVVLFGGDDQNRMPLDDTWVWNGTTWRLLPLATRPTARSHHTMAYDPVRNVIVMTAGAPASSTWELDGTRWVQVALDNARPRTTDSAMGYDPVGRRMLLFGGIDGGPAVADTWSWNGVTWTALTPSGPIPVARSAAGVGNDPESGLLTLFGGHSPPFGCLACDTPSHNDTWQWTGNRWALIAPVAAPVLTDHAGVLDSDRGLVVMFGGADALGFSNATREHDGRHWLKGGLAGPSARYSAGMAYDAARARTVMFGGANGVPMADTWTYNGSWIQMTGTGPPARSSHAMGYDAKRKRVVVFGGQGVSLLGDTWEWDGSSWTQMFPASSPGPRSNPKMAYDPITERLLLFGGETITTLPVNDLWAWDGSSWTLLPAALSPPARVNTGFAWDPARRRMVLFGGGNPIGNDTWEWDGMAWTFVSVGSSALVPSARTGHILVTSPDGAGVLLMGGGQYNVKSNEVWLLRRESADRYETCRTSLDEDLDGLSGCSDADCWWRCTPHCPPGAACELAAPRCGDGICNPKLELCGLCADCTCTVRCGDFVCAGMESSATCPGDCP